jgi:hypothetical protein
MYFTFSGIFSAFHVLAAPHKYTRNGFTVNYPTHRFFIQAITSHFGDICYESLWIPIPNIFFNTFNTAGERFNYVCSNILNQ